MKVLIFLSFIILVYLLGKFSSVVVVSLMWKIGRWSDMSEYTRPCNDLLLCIALVKILSIKVAERRVILVGLLISGIKKDEYNVSMNWLISSLVSIFNRSRLKSPSK